MEVTTRWYSVEASNVLCVVVPVDPECPGPFICKEEKHKHMDTSKPPELDHGPNPNWPETLANFHEAPKRDAFNTSIVSHPAANDVPHGRVPFKLYSFEGATPGSSKEAVEKYFDPAKKHHGKPVDMVEDGAMVPNIVPV